MYPRTRFYRDRQNAKWLGVCAGAADYLGVNPLWVRLGFVALTLMGFYLTIPLYLLAGFLAQDKPEPFYTKTYGEQRFSMRLHDIDHRLRAVETGVTSSSCRLAREIDNLR